MSELRAGVDTLPLPMLEVADTPLTGGMSARVLIIDFRDPRKAQLDKLLRQCYGGNGDFRCDRHEPEKVDRSG